ncbi:MAG: queuosine precursor transporter [Chloracidobacterium sp.]|nr:queuosine precursor transporter [Chloracidobacterium sp.]
MLLTIASVLAITAFTLGGAYYARRFNSPDGLIGLFVLFTTMSQIMASKIAVFDLGGIQVTAPAAVIVFAVTFLMTDIVNERFGQRQVHIMIGITLLTQIAMVVFMYIGGRLEPAPFWPNQPAWDALLGVVPRITFASWITFVVSENLDAWLFAVFKRLTKGRHLWVRNVFSTIPALTVDTLVFVTLAFAGTGFPLWELMKGQFAAKYFVGILCIPFMYLSKAIMGEER